ncbi:MAG: tetratricopeptide repeat protein [Candidatus Kapabacteria bacterium]|nr:tetratricopeptide repeat protein [Candidatus Kapabacteria bacterium]
MKSFALVLILNIVININVFSELMGQAKIDSLLRELPKANEDTNKVNLLHNLTIEYYRINPVEGIKFNKKQLELAKSLKWNLGEAKAYNSYGNNLSKISDLTGAMECYKKALKINEDLSNKQGIASNLGNIGTTYFTLNDYANAMKYFQKAIKINEEIENKTGLANNLTYIGNILRTQTNYDKALDYYQNALKINKEINNKFQESFILTNIGEIYVSLSDDKKALEFFHKALNICEENCNQSSISSILNSIGSVYLRQNNFPLALGYYQKALQMNILLGKKIGIANHYFHIGKIHYKLSAMSNTPDSNTIEVLNKNLHIDSCIMNLEKSLEVSVENGIITNKINVLNLLTKAYYLKGDYRKAYLSYNEYKEIQDSLYSIEKSKEIANLVANREVEIKDKENQILIQKNDLQNLELIKQNQAMLLLSNDKELQHLAFLKEKAEKQEQQQLLNLTDAEMKLQAIKIESLDKDKEHQSAEIKAKNFQRYFFILGILLLIVLFIIAFIRFREKKKLSEQLIQQKNEIEQQKIIVEKQKSLVEEKNEQIYDSIRYASTIQQAMLPWESTLQKAFSDLLIFYKPKDIVSGDSYWFQEVEGIKFLAVIDCTGHGIPGSMLTVIASSVLDDAVLSKRLTDTGEILTYMNSKVTEVLNQRLKENEIRDGMEVALIAVKDKNIQFSGAGRPLYLKNDSFEVIKTEKRGIAGQTENDDYQFSAIEIEKSDNLLLYLTTDGFADQMNEESKKYSTKRFISLLESITEKTISEQDNIIENEFNSHKGTRSQIDDVTILGLKL